MHSTLIFLLTFSLFGQGGTPWLGAPGDCATGRCPLPVAPAVGAVAPRSVDAANGLVDARPIARVVNVYGGVRSLGSGTLVDVDGNRGLIITCAHLFREGVGTITTAFPDGATYEAQLLKIDRAADLAALAIRAPAIQATTIADESPRQGDSLISCGYGGNGQLRCNQGRAVGYVTAADSHGCETLEVTGSARLGDSGGPILNRQGQLVAVVFGTDGRVVDGTYCGRVRQFLAGLLHPARPRPDAGPRPVQTPLAPQGPVAPSLEPPTAPATAAIDNDARERLRNLEQLVQKANETWVRLGKRVDGLVDAARRAGDSSGTALPKIELPADVDRAAPELDSLAAKAAPWMTSKLAAMLIAWGVPGGIAGVAAAGLVWLLMRGARKRLQAQLDTLRRQASGGDASSGTSSTAVVERHHNQFVPFEISAVDKAWASAHAHVGEKYPGAVPYLKIVEGVKDQLLSGRSEPQT